MIWCAVFTTHYFENFQNFMKFQPHVCSELWASYCCKWINCSSLHDFVIINLYVMWWVKSALELAPAVNQCTILSQLFRYIIWCFRFWVSSYLSDHVSSTFNSIISLWLAYYWLSCGCVLKSIHWSSPYANLYFCLFLKLHSCMMQRLSYVLMIAYLYVHCCLKVFTPNINSNCGHDFLHSHIWFIFNYPAIIPGKSQTVLCSPSNCGKSNGVISDSSLGIFYLRYLFIRE